MTRKSKRVREKVVETEDRQKKKLPFELSYINLL